MVMNMSRNANFETTFFFQGPSSSCNAQKQRDSGILTKTFIFFSKSFANCSKKIISIEIH